MSRIIKKTLVVSTTPAYTAGDAVGAKTALGLINATLNSLTVIDAGNQGAAGSILLFDGLPAAATATDNAAFVPSTDLTKVIAQIPVPAYVTTASKKIAHVSNLNLPVKSTGLYAVFVTTGTPTYAAVTDVTIVLGFGPHGS